MEAGLLSWLKQQSPNSLIRTENNVIEITIPKEDIIAKLKEAVPESIRQYVSVEYTNTGLILKVRLM